MDFTLMDIGKKVTITKHGVLRGVTGYVSETLGDGWYVIYIPNYYAARQQLHIYWLSPFKPYYVFNREWGEFIL